MKAFIWSVVGAVVSAILIFFVNAYLESKNRSEAYKVEYSITDRTITLSKDDMNQILARAGEYSDSVTFAEVEIKNVGSEAIENQLATVRIGDVGELSGGILKVGSLKIPGEDPDGVRFDVGKDRIDINYKLLNPDETHRFWFAYDAVAMPSLTMRREGLKLQEPNLSTDESWDIGTWILAFIVLMVIIILGFVWGYSSTVSELKARGINLDDLLKQPKIADAPKGE